jgi:hypothetical protein
LVTDSVRKSRGDVGKTLADAVSGLSPPRALDGA